MVAKRVDGREEDWVAKWVASSAVLLVGYWAHQRVAWTVLWMVG